ncbi:MAG: chromate transporter [Oscillospiraceae bacterium]
MSELLIMCLEFIKTGLFSIGGGLATIPFLFDMSKNHPHWFSSSELADMIAVSESTPGPVGINMATFAGFKIAGFGGAILATLSLVLPSFLIILIIAKFLGKYNDNKYVKAVFGGIKPAAAGLIAAAAYSVFQIAVFTDTISSFSDILPNIHVGNLIIFIVVLTLLQFKKVKKIHPIFFIIISAFIGVAFNL